MQINDPNMVPRCRCCSIGHWSDDVDAEGFCLRHRRTKCVPERDEGYYWVSDKNHPTPIIAYYGKTTCIDQIDRSKRVVSEWGWDLGYEAEDSGDTLGEYDSVGTIVVYGERIKEP